jgi:hypothetical protein
MSSAPLRFILFAGDAYYPSGGMNDVKGSYDTLDEAFAEATRLCEYTETRVYDWAHIYDQVERREVTPIAPETPPVPKNSET